MDGIFSQHFTHIGTQRDTNEDAVLALPEAGLWAVADGMGGHQKGEFASQCVVDQLHLLSQIHTGRDLIDAIPDAIMEANRQIQTFTVEHNLDVVGSTFVALLLEGDQYHCFWTGDSRCYLGRGDQLQPLTRDHTEAEEMIQQGLATRSQLIEARAQNVLTDAVGVDTTVRIEHSQGYLYEGDRFFLCSDGITKVYPDTELLQIILESNVRLDEISYYLLNQALTRGAPDNLSSILIDVFP